MGRVTRGPEQSGMKSGEKTRRSASGTESARIERAWGLSDTRNYGDKDLFRRRERVQSRWVARRRVVEVLLCVIEVRNRQGTTRDGWRARLNDKDNHLAPRPDPIHPWDSLLSPLESSCTSTVTARISWLTFYQRGIWPAGPGFQNLASAEQQSKRPADTAPSRDIFRVLGYCWYTLRYRNAHRMAHRLVRLAFSHST
jgi:hypothetical protein